MLRLEGQFRAVDLLGKGGFFEKKNAGDPNPATIHRDLPIETDEVKPNQETSTEGSTSDDDIESIFSSNTLSTVPSSANPVYTSGIKEVAQALLSQVELKNLYSTAILNLKLRKSRAHIRGCWKEYSRKLAAEVSNELEQKACKFVEELTGRLADEIRGYIAGFKEVNRPAPTESNKKDLEGIEETTNFPRIDQVRDSLLSSQAFKSHLRTLRDWLKVDDKSPIQAGVSGPNASDTQNLSSSHPDKVRSRDPSPSPSQPATSPLDVPSTSHEEAPGISSPIETDDDAPKFSQAPLITDEGKGFESHPVTTSTHQEVPQEVLLKPRRAAPTSCPRQTSARDLFSGPLDFWGVSFFFYDIIELFVPSIAPGRAIQYFGGISPKMTWPTSGGLSTPQRAHLSPGASQNTIQHNHIPGSGSRNERSTPVDAGAHSINVDGLTGTTYIPKYFEVCINAGNHAIYHHELDISHSNSAGELFAMIWDKYKTSRRSALKRILLRPKDVHFVMFSVNPKNLHGTGVHKKPDEYPPEQELDEKRYHYLRPKILMPVNVFLHYLHRARWNT
ncbi:hypothetical protein MGN70_006926 [Eutypa lata]|nr:hypothetical protein MGN70_006926 [Eutypa lata]